MAEKYISVENHYIYEGTMQEGDRIATDAEIQMFQRGILGITVKDYENRVQKYLDDTVRTKGYDDVYTCIGYNGDPDPIFDAEAKAVLSWRSHVWRKAQSILNDYAAGKIVAPTFEELLTQLPVLVWPDTVEGK